MARHHRSIAEKPTITALFKRFASCESISVATRATPSTPTSNIPSLKIAQKRHPKITDWRCVEVPSHHNLN